MHYDEINEVAENLCDAAKNLGRSWIAKITTEADDDCRHAVVEIVEPLARGRSRKLAEIQISPDSTDETKAMAETHIWGAASTVRGLVTGLGLEIV